MENPFKEGKEDRVTISCVTKKLAYDFKDSS